MLEKITLWSKRKPLAWHMALFFFALLPRLLVIWWHSDVHLISEMNGYVNSARDLLAGGEFSGMPGYRSFLAPGLSFFYMVGMSLFGTDNLFMLRVLQAILGALTVNATYSLARSWSNEKLGVASGLIFAVLPVNIFIPDFLLTEALYTFISILGFLIVSHDSSKIWRWAVAGIIWGLATLVRPVMLYFPIFLLLFTIIFARSKLPWKGILISLVLMTAIISPWTIRNYRIHGVFMPVESKSGLDFYLYNHGTFNDIITNYSNEDEERQVYFSETTEAARSTAFARAGVDWILHNPILFSFKMVRHFWNFYGLEREISRHMRYNYYGPQPIWLNVSLAAIIVIPSALMLLLVVPGVLSPSKDRLSELPSLLYLLYMTIIAMIANGFSRQRYPITPFLVIYAARAMIMLPQSLPWRMHGWRRTVTWIWWVTLTSGWLVEVAVDLTPALEFFSTGKPLI